MTEKQKLDYINRLISNRETNKTIEAITSMNDTLKKTIEIPPIVEDLKERVENVEANIKTIKAIPIPKDGIDGKDGKNGINGRDGKDGKNGIDGLNGKDGLNGIDGKDGINGKDAIGIESVELDGSDLIVKLNGETKNLGRVKGQSGYNGRNGIGIIPGGTTNQVLSKNSNDDFDFKWSSGGGGNDGKSAYQVAVDNGFSGTEEQWLESLKGEKGEKGDQGIQGIQGVQGVKGDTGGSADPIQLEDRPTPVAPTSGLTIFSRKRAGRSSLNQIGSSGIDTPLQPALFGNSIYLWLPSASTTVSIAFSTTWTARNASGAQSHPAKATTNFLTQMNRALFSCTATTATGSGIQSTSTVGARGNASGIGGFYFFSRFGMETVSGTGQQVLVGLSALNAALGGEPSVQTNTIGICKDSTDTNWQLVSRNASASTKVDTGVAVTAGQVFSLYMFCKPNDSKVTVRLARENDCVVVLDDVEVTATLPVNTVFMYAHAQLRNTGTAINALALNRIYVECDI